ncbi:MAG: hypothetical protein D6814_16275, partial [Calditrichaeota bacterium]
MQCSAIFYRRPVRFLLLVLFSLLASFATIGAAPTTPSKFSKMKTRPLASGKSQAAPLSKARLVQMSRNLQKLISPRHTAAKRSRSVTLQNALQRLQKHPIVLPHPIQSTTPARLKIYRNEHNETPIFISGEALHTFRPKASGALSTAEIALAFIEANRTLFKLDHPAAELKEVEAFQDFWGKQHVKFSQVYEGIPIWGHEIIAHLNPDGTLYGFNARYAPTPRGLEVHHVKLDRQAAIQSAVANLQKTTKVETFSPALQKVLHYTGPVAKKYIWIDVQTQKPHLVWHVQIRPNIRDNWTYFVDAQTGEILEKYNATQTEGPTTANAVDLNGVTRTLNVYEKDGVFYMLDASRPIWQAQQPDVLNDPKGGLWTIDVRGNDLNEKAQLFHVTSNDNTWNDKVSVSAHYNVGQVFEYYFNTFGRKAIDGKGSTIISVIHVTDNGNPMDNAYWNGALMAYGDGNTDFFPLAGALDVAAHEMTHGVIQYTVN